jgi:hypothetical protein
LANDLQGGNSIYPEQRITDECHKTIAVLMVYQNAILHPLEHRQCGISEVFKPGLRNKKSPVAIITVQVLLGTNMLVNNQ